MDRGVDDFLDEGYSPPRSPPICPGTGMSTRPSTSGWPRRSRRSGTRLRTGETINDGEVGDQRAGRLVDPNGGIGEDTEKDMVADDIGIDGAAASAEEAAVHIVPDSEIY